MFQRHRSARRKRIRQIQIRMRLRPIIRSALITIHLNAVDSLQTSDRQHVADDGLLEWCEGNKIETIVIHVLRKSHESSTFYIDNHELTKGSLHRGRRQKRVINHLEMFSVDRTPLPSSNPFDAAHNPQREKCLKEKTYKKIDCNDNEDIPTKIHRQVFQLKHIA